MTGVGQALQTIAQLLGGNNGPILLSIAITLTFSAPLVERYVIRPKRLQYRVLYNSKIGLSPEEWYDRGRPEHADPQLVRTAQLLERMSIVVIRFRNVGSKSIEADDFEEPISVTFGGRTIWDARISEVGRDSRRNVIEVSGLDGRVRSSLEFATSKPSAAKENLPLSALRDAMRGRLENWFGISQTELPPTVQYDNVRLRGLRLGPRERFKLVVVLREPDGNEHTQLTKQVEVNGRVANHKPSDQKNRRRFTWQRITVAVAILLTGALITILIPWQHNAKTDASVSCAAGDLRIEGSSAFAPIVGNIATAYHRSCDQAVITVNATGSINGVRAFATHGGRNDFGVLSDGKSSEDLPDLVTHSVAIIVYSLIVNGDVGMDKLSTDQLKGIYSGRYRDWQQLRQGPSLPIRIVSRGQESGTRATFERKVLGFSEGSLSSDSCLTPERNPQAPIIRCERNTTAQQVDQIASSPGAIGYSDTPAVKTATARNAKITPVQLDGRYPDESTISTGYPFWTVEYLYTKGVPDNDSVLKNFIDYLSNGSARAELQDAGYTPCVTKAGLVLPLCSKESGH